MLAGSFHPLSAISFIKALQRFMILMRQTVTVQAALNVVPAPYALSAEDALRAPTATGWMFLSRKTRTVFLRVKKRGTD